MRCDLSLSGRDLSIPLVHVVFDAAFKLVRHQRKITVGRDSKNYQKN